MTKDVSFYDRLKHYPWKLFGQLNPLFKVIVIVLALGAWVPDPLDIVGISFWGILAGILFQKMVATWIVVILSVLFWIITQMIESLLVILVTVYLIPAGVGLICMFFEKDPNPIIFNS
ncbi:MAG: hypothetical protein UT17_C0004G0243 [Candidatus Woesebacteria bacterium GW2011_GWB1_39_10]|uniref:Uncharacterized protein n=2 Tax=Candidatus Woeseibacteriota TaxID=1752722 RepID=A0A0G0LV63_9BACT|nr:MAG: hypothetical protein UT17_C0004G0243 [Candidatus Woesebacteria bacterium GW2011_GWB1_39_10]KKS90885.1 MAG: hypothetical protein UV66_C0001G0242 [Candidatus Woesebacteria bacterium GW2011_GWA1_43_12]